METFKVKCSKCNSENIVKREIFETKAHGKQQRLNVPNKWLVLIELANQKH